MSAEIPLSIWKDKLQNLYSDSEIRTLFRYAQKDFSTNSEDKLRSVLEELASGKPYAYILGEADFYGRKFLVSPDVLIPRPETEELVELVISHCHGKNKPRILDIGTGSGCIAISLALGIKHSSVFGIDVSKGALQIAQKNAQLLNAEVSFQNEDIRDIASWSFPKFDLIVSNPPYIPPSQASNMQKQVVEFEPALALFSPESDSLFFYRCILSNLRQQLHPGGFAFFEIHYDQANAFQDLCKSFGFSVKVEKDLSGNDRMGIVSFTT